MAFVVVCWREEVEKERGGSREYGKNERKKVVGRRRFLVLPPDPLLLFPSLVLRFLFRIFQVGCRKRHAGSISSKRKQLTWQTTRGVVRLLARGIAAAATVAADDDTSDVIVVEAKLRAKWRPAADGSAHRLPVEEAAQVKFAVLGRSDDEEEEEKEGPRLAAREGEEGNDEIDVGSMIEK